MSKARKGSRVTPPVTGDIARRRAVKDLAEVEVDTQMVFQFLSERGIAEWNAAVERCRTHVLAERLADAQALLEQMPDLHDAATAPVRHEYPGDTPPEPVDDGQEAGPPSTSPVEETPVAAEADLGPVELAPA